MAYDEELNDVPCTFDPMKSDLKEVFKDDIARAIWMAYRFWHICSGEMLKGLREGSLKIARKIRKNPDILKKPIDEIGYWIAREICCYDSFAFNAFTSTMYEPKAECEEFAEFILPYLKGEKIATFKIKSHEGDKRG